MRRWVLLGACWLLIACQPRQTGSENGVWVPDLRVVGRTQDYETVRYERDGVPLYAEIYRPKGKSRAPAVVLLPGGFVGVNANHRAAARRLAQAGYLVGLPHMRGQGKSGGFIDFGLEDAVDVRGLARAPRRSAATAGTPTSASRWAGLSPSTPPAMTRMCAASYA
jgi:alpha-beta hydrolase superfamily lysophospholipase